jgi:hypothetical protein
MQRGRCAPLCQAGRALRGREGRRESGLGRFFVEHHIACNPLPQNSFYILNLIWVSWQQKCAFLIRFHEFNYPALSLLYPLGIPIARTNSKTHLEALRKKRLELVKQKNRFPDSLS